MSEPLGQPSSIVQIKHMVPLRTHTEKTPGDPSTKLAQEVLYLRTPSSSCALRDKNISLSIELDRVAAKTNDKGGEIISHKALPQVGQLDREAIRKRLEEVPGKSYSEKCEALIQLRAQDVIRQLTGTGKMRVPISDLMGQIVKSRESEIFSIAIQGGRSKAISESPFVESDFVFHRTQKFFIAPLKYKEKIESFKELLAKEHQIHLEQFEAHYVEDSSWEILTQFLHEVKIFRTEVFLLEQEVLSPETKIKKTPSKGSESKRVPLLDLKLPSHQEKHKAKPRSTTTEVEEKLKQRRVEEESYKKERAAKKEEFQRMKEEKWEKYEEKQRELRKENLKSEEDTKGQITPPVAP